MCRAVPDCHFIGLLLWESGTNFKNVESVIGNKDMESQNMNIPVFPLNSKMFCLEKTWFQSKHGDNKTSRIC